MARAAAPSGAVGEPTRNRGLRCEPADSPDAVVCGLTLSASVVAVITS